MHMLIHTKRDLHNCQQCERRFRSAGILKRHQRRMHSSNENKLSIFPKEENKNTKVNKKSFACDDCHKRFTSHQKLERHRSRSFKCTDVNDDGKVQCTVCTRRIWQNVLVSLSTCIVQLTNHFFQFLCAYENTRHESSIPVHIMC